MASILVSVTKDGVTQADIGTRVYRYGTRERLCAERGDGRATLETAYLRQGRCVCRVGE